MGPRRRAQSARLNKESDMRDVRTETLRMKKQKLQGGEEKLRQQLANRAVNVLRHQVGVPNRRIFDEVLSHFVTSGEFHFPPEVYNLAERLGVTLRDVPPPFAKYLDAACAYEGPLYRECLQAGEILLAKVAVLFDFSVRLVAKKDLKALVAELTSLAKASAEVASSLPAKACAEPATKKKKRRSSRLPGRTGPWRDGVSGGRCQKPIVTF